MTVFHKFSSLSSFLGFQNLILVFSCCANVLHGVIKWNILYHLAFHHLYFENNTYFCNDHKKAPDNSSFSSKENFSCAAPLQKVKAVPQNCKAVIPWKYADTALILFSLSLSFPLRSLYTEQFNFTSVLKQAWHITSFRIKTEML